MYCVVVLALNDGNLYIVISDCIEMTLLCVE